MKIVLLASLALCVGMSCRGVELPRSAPEAQGVSSAAVLDFLETANAKIEGMHSIMLLRHGQVIAEGWWAPYSSESPHVLWSLSKSFTSTAVGIAIGEGKFSLDDPVLKFFPDDAPAEPSANLKSMRVSDLLRMQTGQESEAKRVPDVAWTKTFLAQPVKFKPGTHFVYNSLATYMASAIVQKTTGMTVLDYLKPRLFEPLGINVSEWESSPQGINAGGWGLHLRTEDIARFGQLYLQKGKWQGTQLVPEAWVQAATSMQTSNGSNPKSDWDQGYCYQFWRCQHNAYRGDGAFGQYCVVMPDQDAVLVVTSGIKNMQSVLDLVWEKLLPAMGPTALPANADAAKKLETTLKSLTIPPQQGTATPAKATSKKYIFPANDAKLEALKIESDGKDGAVTLVLKTAGVEQKILCGKGAWQKGRAAWGLLKEQPVAASGAWTADDTYSAKLSFYETAYLVTVQLTFAGDEVQCKTEINVNFGPTKGGPFIGKAE